MGDLGRLADSCPCGRRDGLILERLEGRVKHCTVLPDGGMVTPAELDVASRCSVEVNPAAWFVPLPDDR